MYCRAARGPQETAVPFGSLETAPVEIFLLYFDLAVAITTFFDGHD